MPSEPASPALPGESKALCGFCCGYKLTIIANQTPAIRSLVRPRTGSPRTSFGIGRTYNSCDPHRHLGKAQRQVPVFFAAGTRLHHLGRISSIGRPQRRDRTGGYDEGLTERMSVPCGARDGLESHAGAFDECWMERLE